MRGRAGGGGGGGVGAYIWRGDVMEGFLRYEFGEIIFGGAYFRNFIFILVECLIFTNVFTSMHIIFLKNLIFKNVNLGGGVNFENSKKERG